MDLRGGNFHNWQVRAMKAKVVGESSGYTNEIVDVRQINYGYVYGLLSDGSSKVKIPFEDVEFIFDSTWEESVIKYRDVLKISIPPAVSMGFYAALSHVLEQHYEGDIESIDILSDDNEKSRKGYWYKKTVVVINNCHPVFITASGRNYTNNYNISMEDMDPKSFACQCREGIVRLRKSMDREAEQLKLYEKALNGVQNPVRGRRKHKAIGGRSSPSC
jgi:hypothetical protein